LKRIRISIAFALPEKQQVVPAILPDGVSLQEALKLLANDIEKLAGDAHSEVAGVWGRVRPPHYILCEGDRIELYRPLKADPKQARRARIGKHVK
jgi:putative ubiquitin-RnfH superfamily antitoxin RatB of RatAB toxin-antitoxin module